MIKTIFHFFKIHRKMIFGNTPIVVQDMLGITPEPFNTVDVVLASIGKGFAVIQPMVFSPALQGIIATEGIGIIPTPFSYVFLYASSIHRRSPVPQHSCKPSRRAPEARRQCFFRLLLVHAYPFVFLQSTPRQSQSRP